MGVVCEEVDGGRVNHDSEDSGCLGLNHSLAASSWEAGSVFSTRSIDNPCLLGL